MKKIAFAVLLQFIVLSVCAQGVGSMFIDGSVNSYDTLEFRNIAPGMQYTKVRFPRTNRSGYQMIVVYITIDMTNPYNSQTSYLAQDKFYASHTQLDEYNYQRSQGKNAVATVMGGAFVQIGSNNPLRPSWEVANGLVSDGRLLTDPSGSCFYIDSNNKACVGNVRLQASVTKADGTAFNISNINRYRGNSQGVTLFCNNYGESRDIYEGGKEILLTLIDNNMVGTSGNYRCKVEEVYSGTNHIFAGNQIILSARGNAEANFGGITKGDEITLSISCLDEANANISIMQSSTPLFGYGVRNGQPQPSNRQQYAQCAFGVSQDGNTTYWYLLEHSDQSNAPVYMLNEFMANTGAWDATLMDGGPSAEMTVNGEWATPNEVGGNFNGRNVPCGLIAYSTAPADNNVVQVNFKNVRADLYLGYPYTPEFYGLNQYGEVISTNAGASSDVYITCDQSVGTVSDDGKSFTPTTGKSGFIYGHVKGSDIVCSMWVQVSSISAIEVSPHNFFTELGRGAYASLQAISPDGTATPLDPALATWTATNEWVCSVDYDGWLWPNEQDNDGDEALIIAEYLGLKDTINVVVETIDEDFVHLTSKVEDAGNINLQLPGVPTSFLVEVAAPESTGAHVYLIYKKGDTPCTEQLGYVKPGKSVSKIIELDKDEIYYYPVTIEKITCVGDANVKLQQLTAAYRGAQPTAITEISNDTPVRVTRSGDDVIVSWKGTATGNTAECILYSVDGKQLTPAIHISSDGSPAVINSVKEKPLIVLIKDGVRKYIYKIQ